MNSKDITATQGRTLNVFNNAVNNSIQNTVPQMISTAIDKEKIRTGVIIKFFPYVDKAEVKIDNTNEVVLCKILHRFGGEMIDFFTPLEYEKGFDTRLQEPYIIPKASQNVCVLNIHDADSEENLILGYYHNEEIVGYNPAQPGNIKLMYKGEDTLYWIKFGRDGFEYRLSSKPTMQVGDLDENMEDINYAHSSDIYTKDEVDDLLEDYENRIKKLEEKLSIEDTTTTITNPVDDGD